MRPLIDPSGPYGEILAAAAAEQQNRYRADLVGDMARCRSKNAVPTGMWAVPRSDF